MSFFQTPKHSKPAPYKGHPKAIDLDSNAKTSEDMSFMAFKVNSLPNAMSEEQLDAFYRKNGMTPPSHHMVRKSTEAELWVEYLASRTRFIRFVLNSDEYKAKHDPQQVKNT